MIAIQFCIAIALLAVVFIYGVLALTDIDFQPEVSGYQPLVADKSKAEAPGDE